MPATQHTHFRTTGKIDVLAARSSIIPTFGNLLMWYDANSISGKSQGDRVTTLSDLSGNGNDITAVTNGAIYDTNAFFGKPSLNFNGSNTNMGANSRLVPLTDISIFLVLRYSTGRALGLENDGSGTDGLSWYNNSSWVIRTSGANNDVSFSGQVANGTIYSLLLGSGGTAGSMSKCNATAQTTGTGTAYTDASVNFHLGSSGNSSSLFSGYIAEVAIYSAKLSETNRDAIHVALNDKWQVF